MINRKRLEISPHTFGVPLQMCICSGHWLHGVFWPSPTCDEVYVGTNRFRAWPSLFQEIILTHIITGSNEKAGSKSSGRWRICTFPKLPLCGGHFHDTPTCIVYIMCVPSPHRRRSPDEILRFCMQATPLGPSSCSLWMQITPLLLSGGSANQPVEFLVVPPKGRGEGSASSPS